MCDSEQYKNGYANGCVDTLDIISDEVTQFMLKTNSQNIEFDYACNYILNVIKMIKDKKLYQD